MESVIMQRRHHRNQWVLLSALVVGVLLVGAIVGSAITAKGWFPFKGGESKGVPVYLAADQRVIGSADIGAGFSAVAKAVTPAVVTITVSSRTRAQQSPNFLDPFRDFFGRPDEDDEQTPRRRSPQAPGGRAPLRPSGVGSGVIVSPDGYILTNNHVVESADKVEVELADRRHLIAKVVGTDPLSDVAVIKVEGSGLPTVAFGDSEKVEVGDVVLAIGNPLGIGQTVTMGIISAKGRTTTASSVGGGGSYEDFLQTDAAINRGNSGGALVNLRGELIGIPSQILSQTGGNIGIGFAIPAAMARSVMDQLVRTGKVRRGKLGVIVQAIDPEVVGQFGYKGTKGAFVQDVQRGEPGDQAGVKPGDIITEFQGTRIETSSQLRNMIAQNAPGTAVKFKVWRDGTERELTAKLSDATPAKPGNETSSVDSGAASSTLSGVRVENLTAEWAQRLNLPSTARGVVVKDVAEDSAAAEAGIRPGDVIEEVGRQPVTNVNEFNAAVQKAGKRPILLRVRNARGASFVLVQPQE